MFKLRYVHVKNWCQHVDRRVEFAAGTTCILGPNGSGKSNLVYAAFVGLTGELLTDDTIGDNINWKAESASIEVGFTVDGVDAVVVREYTAPFLKGEAGLLQTREEHKTTATLKLGDEKKISGPKKVTDKIASILGLTSSVIRDHIIVPQGKLRDLLFKAKQERIKAFQSLVPALCIVEKKRADLRLELERHPAISIGLSRDEIQRMLDQVRQRAGELSTELQTLKARNDAVGDLDTIRRRIAKAEMAHLAENELRLTLPRCDEARNRLRTLQQQHHEVTERLRTLDAAVTSGNARAMELRRMLSILDQNANAFMARKQISDQLARANAELASKSEPVPFVIPDWYEKAKTDYADMQAAVAAANKVLAFLRQGKSVCPTCGTTFLDLAKQQAYQQDAIAKMTPMLAEYERAVSQVNTLVQNSQKAVQDFGYWQRGLQTNIQQLSRALATMPPGEPADETQKMAWKGELDIHDRLSLDLERTKATVTTAATQVATAQGEVTRHERDVARLQQETADKLSESTVQELRNTLAEGEDTQRQYHVRSGEFTAHERELERLQRQYDAVEADKALAVATDKYRAMLENAYTVLHRDQLPQSVMQSYLVDLNRLCSRYLDQFGNPFSVAIPRDFDIIVTRPDGYTYPASRESGGRQCVLSIVFRFAINQLFAAQAGIIVLDEPTAYLDVDNVAYVAGIVDHMQRVRSETGLQIIMITHEKELVGSFDRVEELQ